MKQALVQKRSTRLRSSGSMRRPIAGPNGMAVVPPAYGIDFLDRQQRAAAAAPGGSEATVQRQEEEDEEEYGEELLQGKFDSRHRTGTGDEGQQMQMGTPAGPSAQFQPESTPYKNNTGLPDHLKAGIESLSGMPMDEVRVHYNSSAPATLHALAYTQGTEIHVAPGQEQHLPHEAWHVVQQGQGRVQPTMQRKGGVPVNADKGLEHEADVMGEKANQPGAAPGPAAVQLQSAGCSTGCGCASCSPSMESTSAAPTGVSGLAAAAGSTTLVQRKSEAPPVGNGVVQLFCGVCAALGEDSDHGKRTCPYRDESEEELVPEEVIEGPEKVPGWKKKGKAKVKVGKGERELRKRKGHGMMTKDQARRYVPNY